MKSHRQTRTLLHPGLLLVVATIVVQLQHQHPGYPGLLLLVAVTIVVQLQRQQRQRIQRQ